MDVLFFLKERTRLIRQYYVNAASPFNEIIRKIEAKEEEAVIQLRLPTERLRGEAVGADCILTDPADPILTQGGLLVFESATVDKFTQHLVLLGPSLSLIVSGGME